ncbi:MAG: flagella assembly protein FlgT middle domain-containing protein [Methylomonas sp.]
MPFLLLGCSDGKQRLTSSDIEARQISAEGSAFVGEGGKGQARREAMDAAIAVASEQLKRKNTATNLIGDVKVVDEWQEGNVYHVQILAVLSDKQSCASFHRKKIVATAFPIATSGQISGTESQDLYGGIPREINNRLMESGDFIGHNLTNTVLYTRPDMAPEILPSSNYSGSSIINIAQQHGAQFVLSGVIRDFKIESGEYVRGSGILAGIKAQVRDIIGRRSIGIDVYVHDGFTGALLFQHRYTDSILGDISLPAGYTVGSERFNATPAGHKIDQIIRQASEDIRSVFGCYPFASRVTEVFDHRVVIAAGAQDKVKVGDKFKVYPAFSNADGAGVAITAGMGILTITEVSSNAAQGILDDESQTFRVLPGFWVKTLN